MIYTNIWYSFNMFDSMFCFICNLQLTGFTRNSNYLESISLFTPRIDLLLLSRLVIDKRDMHAYFGNISNRLTYAHSANR